jgi:arylformamidase
MIDISLPLQNRMITYPGDAHYEEYPYKTHEKDHVHITRVLMETHSGTHFDAPFHMLPDGKKASEIPLDQFQGRASVVYCSGAEIREEDIPSRHESIVLFKTKNSEKYSEHFDTGFTYIGLGAAKKLVADGCKLVGIDYMSVEKFNSPEPVVHKTLLRADVIIMEGLYLKDVQPGEYNFMCLPLRMSEDGAPCRAVLY